jgi:phage replication-related protein YjqB (UPF0714/DUF867 family)
VRKIAAAVHGGGIEKGTSEIALAVAGFHPQDMSPLDDGRPRHDFWLFEGLLPHGNDKLHVTSSNYDEPIATQLITAAKRCVSIHGCRDDQAKGKIQLGGRDPELRGYVLEELTAAGIAAQFTKNELLNGDLESNICNMTTSRGCAQLELGTSYRSSLFGIDTRPQRKNTTNQEFWKLVGALRKAFDRIS